MLLLPISVTFLPAIKSVLPRISLRIEITPNGVHDTKYGVCLFSARLPMLNGCRPSTSFSGPIKLITYS